MNDLAEFLLARIAEDEAVALDVHRSLCDSLTNPQGVAPGPCDCGTPARVLAECEAKRRIVQHEAPGPRSAADSRLQWAYTSPVLALLALPHADHPDYDPAWRP